MKIRVQWRKFSDAHARKVLRWAEAGFFIAGCVTLGFCVWIYFEAERYQASESGQFENAASFDPAARTELALKLNRALPSIKELRPEAGSPFSKIEIPRLGISVVVLEGTEPKYLRLGAGHMPGTALPGERGNVAIAAHRDTFFRNLGQIQRQDRITLTTLRGSFAYSVESTQIVDPTAVEVLQPTEQPTLTLITCYPFWYIGSAPKRFVVKARQESY